LQHAGEPSWFYQLKRQEQIAVLAHSRIQNKPKKQGRSALPPNVTMGSEKASRFWLGD